MSRAPERPANKKPSAKRSALEDKTGFAKALIDWFDENGRSYPWRETRDPYAILVSEVMLQQTRVATVLDRGFFTRWMSCFPDLRTLAAASEEEVLRLWEGLGYYRRARQLRALAKYCVEHTESAMPTDLDGIRQLPGVGRYTAGAIMSFAFDRSAPIVDGNVARVFSRLMDYDQLVDSSIGQKQMWQWAEALVPAKGARSFNSALMELGQRVCLKGLPKCQECPVKAFCLAKEPSLLPKRKPLRETVLVDEHAAIFRRDGKILLAKETQRRKGLWRLPLRPPKEFAKIQPIYHRQYSITHHRVTLRIYLAKIMPNEGERWFYQTDLESLPISSPYRKAITESMKITEKLVD